MAERALELEPDHPLFRLQRAVLLRRLGDFEGAREDLRVLAASPDLPLGVRDVVERERWTVHEALGAPDSQGPRPQGPRLPDPR